jgi:hypothetical protein
VVRFCANPGCDAEFLYLHEGELVIFHPPNQDAKYFWLCAVCCQYLQVELDASGEAKVIPRGDVSEELGCSAA